MRPYGRGRTLQALLQGDYEHAQDKGKSEYRCFNPSVDRRDGPLVPTPDNRPNPLRAATRTLPPRRCLRATRKRFIPPGVGIAGANRAGVPAAPFGDGSTCTARCAMLMGTLHSVHGTRPNGIWRKSPLEASAGLFGFFAWLPAVDSLECTFTFILKLNGVWPRRGGIDEVANMSIRGGDDVRTSTDDKEPVQH